MRPPSSYPSFLPLSYLHFISYPLARPVMIPDLADHVAAQDHYPHSWLAVGPRGSSLSQDRSRAPEDQHLDFPAALSPGLWSQPWGWRDGQRAQATLKFPPPLPLSGLAQATMTTQGMYVLLASAVPDLQPAWDLGLSCSRWRGKQHLESVCVYACVNCESTHVCPRVHM